MSSIWWRDCLREHREKCYFKVGLGSGGWEQGEELGTGSGLRLGQVQDWECLPVRKTKPAKEGVYAWLKREALWCQILRGWLSETGLRSEAKNWFLSCSYILGLIFLRWLKGLIWRF